jgi:hypothetical protein
LKQIDSGADLLQLLDVWTPDLGDLPGWGQAISTTAALFYAWRASRTARQLYEIERQRQREQELRTARSQPERVCVWMEEDPESEESFVQIPLGSGQATQARRWEPLAVFLNGSELPVFDASVFFSRKDVAVIDRVSIPVVPPNSTFRVKAPRDVCEPPVFGSGEYSYEISATFRDAAGVAWHRDARGILTEDPTAHFVAERAKQRAAAKA